MTTVQEIILRLDQAQEARVLSEEEARLLKDLKVRVLGLAAIERARSRQTSRLTWLKHGDACTKFFHLRMSARKRRNFIPALRRRDGTFAWNHDEKEKEAFDHYKTLLGTKVSRARSLNWDVLQLPEIEEGLDDPFTEEEIKKAISCLPSDKAPGPDGFTGAFYKSCWHIIKAEVLDAFNCLYSLNTGPLERMNSAVITLIPKK